MFSSILSEIAYFPSPSSKVFSLKCCVMQIEETLFANRNPFQRLSCLCTEDLDYSRIILLKVIL